MKGFIQFIRKQGVVGLATGFILGGSVSKLVSSIVDDLVNPLLGLVLGSAQDLSTYSLTLGGATVKWGHFLSTLLDFVVIALVVYGAFKLLRLDRLDKKD